MGLFTKIIFLILTIASAYILYLYLFPGSIPKVPDEFWGPASMSGKPEDVSIREFKIQVDDKVIKDLKSRIQLELDANRFAPPLGGIGFEYGFNTKFLPKVLSHWVNKYDWRTREKLLNKYPQFKTKIGGIDIHFQRIKSDKNYKKTLPLLILHGWPGSFVEFQKMIPMLTDPKGSEYNYELIIPSLPGYGFSEAAARPGMDTVAMSNIFLRLMKRLGHEKFNIMGGDWGALIVADMAALYPDNILGVHSTMCASMHPLSHLRLFLVSFFPFLGEPGITERILPLSKLFKFIMLESGYFHIQATKPDTVGVALSQSPSGLAAYILEKFSTWTDRTKITREDGGLLEKFTMDELLDNLMVYWVTNSVTSSMRLYSEAFASGKKYITDSVPITIPAACLMLPEELSLSPEFTLRDKYYSLEQFTIANKGGHFGSFEVPEIVSEDALKFFNSLQKQPAKSKQ